MSVSPPHVSIPYALLKEHIEFIRSKGLCPEVYLNADALDTLDGNALDRLADTLAGTRGCSIHGPFMDLSPGAEDRKVRAVTAERFNHVLDIAGHINPRTIVFHSGYERWKYGLEITPWLDGAMGFWPPLIKRAREIGASITIENIFEHEPKNLVMLMERLGSPEFGICFDAGHANLFSKLPIRQWVDALGPHIIELHLHDNDGSFDAHRPIGEGTVRFDELFSLMGGKTDVVHTLEARSPADVLASRRRLDAYRASSPI